MTNRVPQGMGSSPMLFDIYSETLLNDLNKCEYYSQMYADDLVCIVQKKKS